MEKREGQGGERGEVGGRGKVGGRGEVGERGMYGEGVEGWNACMARIDGSEESGEEWNRGKGWREYCSN